MKKLLAAILTLQAGTALADEGFYVGAGLGWFDDEAEVLGTEVDFERQDYRLFYGYRFNDYLSLQADMILADFDVDAAGSTGSTRPLLGELSVKPSVPLGTDRVQLFARAGYAFDIREDDADFELSEWSWAGGLEVFVAERWAVRAEYYGVDWERDSFENGVWGLAFTYNMQEGR
ncbi:MAG: porin family protein [Pseudomonadota bacterium]